ncbi:MAG: NAD-dependent deacylase [Prolixibacteraceae bacterium]|nr:NAD-dependent deacylase [Prolixibacteraceae bacterium]
MEQLIKKAARLIKKADFTMAFTGAGISVESGIPPFRGETGLWSRYNPKILDLEYFRTNPEECWYYIREIFYDFFGAAQPNAAHKVLAHMEQQGFLHSVVTQNIDNLHQQAGSINVREFHGNSKKLVCLKCGKEYRADDFDFKNIPPLCAEDGEVLKPNFIFFGEGIPQEAYSNSFADAERADVCIVIGSTGEIMPASYVPRTAKQSGATIIEINPEKSMFTNQLTDIYLQGKATKILLALEKEFVAT